MVGKNPFLVVKSILKSLKSTIDGGKIPHFPGAGWSWTPLSRYHAVFNYIGQRSNATIGFQKNLSFCASVMDQWIKCEEFEARKFQCIWWWCFLFDLIHDIKSIQISGSDFIWAQNFRWCARYLWFRVLSVTWSRISGSLCVKFRDLLYPPTSPATLNYGKFFIGTSMIDVGFVCYCLSYSWTKPEANASKGSGG